MGLESYFMHLLPDGVAPAKADGANAFEGSSSAEVLSVIKTVQSAVPSRSISVNCLVVDNAIELVIEHKNELFVAATLTGCFAWYEKGLCLCYKVASLIESCVDVSVYHPLLGIFPLASEQEFCETVRGAYKEKYQSFLRTFGNVEMKTLPGNDFYDRLHSSQGARAKIRRSLYRFRE